jgi:hypothetical protein
MSLSKQIINRQLEEIVNEYFTSNDNAKNYSSAYTVYTIHKLMDVSIPVAYESFTDGTNDLKIDGLYFDEPSDDVLDISLFQIKYSLDFSKDKGFKENDIIGIINTLRNMFGNLSRFEIAQSLETKLNEINSYISMGNIPSIKVYLVNNGKKWEPNGESQIEAFLDESIMNREIFEFIYINHNDLLAISTKDKKINCMLNFNGKFIDEELNFKRALIGTVPVKNIAEVMEQHHYAILKQNVRDFLGTKGINQNIKDTLEDKEERKNFYFLNNGITIVCSNVGYAPSSNASSTIIKLTNAQIINGGQTSKTIQNVINDEKNIDEDFSETSVLVRIYKVDEENLDDSNLIDKITLATNSQNAIKLSDLRANDTVQQKIEVGLEKYNIKYIRRRDNKRAKKGDIRKEILAEVILSAILKRPNEAKYKKALHFGMLYKEIFNEKIINIETIIALIKAFTFIETKRKTATMELIKEYPFIPYATHHILMEFYKLNQDDGFEENFIKALDILKVRFQELNVDMEKSLDVIATLKSNKLNEN